MARFKIGGSLVTLTKDEPTSPVEAEVIALQNMGFMAAIRRQFQKDYLNESINWKQRVVESVAKYKTPDGGVYLERSGMDCDCVSYAGDVMYIPDATPKEVARSMDHCEQWADGPVHYRFITEAEAKQMRYRSCDLIARAHEDGHPWCVSGADCNF